jgi:hypothetical protein
MRRAVLLVPNRIVRCLRSDRLGGSALASAVSPAFGQID